MSEMTKAELQDLQERWLALKPIMEDFCDAIVAILKPAIEKMVQAILAWFELVRREYLYQSLPRWMPDGVRRWVADRLPARFLPRFDKIFVEVSKGEQ